MTSREALLRALRSQALPELALPALDARFVRYDDPLAEFSSAVERAAGRVVSLKATSSVEQAFSKLTPLQRDQAICSLVPEFPGNVPLDGSAHSFAQVDVLVLAASLGVAENGALWVTDQSIKQRSVFFLAEHVVALLDRDQIVHNMHEAYARIQVGASPFGCFVAGPSKTADIEQALVIGAHGPRSLTVVLR